ncbi:uncharacterized protein LOC141812473 [Curcuma longa]|uniref:uncharacterized protein LOC141812473 n=1 Tax=Curcuma longa TaxID=136217 RepID=UPI003D9DFFD5
MDALSKRVENMNVGKVNAVATSCDICGDSSHTKEMCQVGALQAQIAQYEQCDAVGTYNQRNNPYSNSYNPGWRNHPNFSYRNNQGPSYQAAPKPSEEVSDTQKILKILEQLQSDMVKVNEKLDDHDKRMKMQETQIAQISSSLSSRQVGALPGKPDFNPMEHCKAIELRSGRTLKGKEPQVTAPLEGITSTTAAEQPPSSTPIIEDELEEVETATPAEVPTKKPLVRNIPFPQRLLYKQKDDEFEKLYNRVKDITLDIPLLDALVEMPKFAKLIKGLMSTKNITQAKNTVALTEEVSAIILNNKLPPKLKDPGASVSIIPYSTSEKCGYTDLKLTTMAIQLADHSCRYPMGIVEDVPVEVERIHRPNRLRCARYGGRSVDPYHLGEVISSHFWGKD